MNLQTSRARWLALVGVAMIGCAANTNDGAGDDENGDVSVADEALRGPLVDVPFSEFEDPAGIGNAGQRETRIVITRAATYRRLFGHAAPKGIDFDKDAVAFYSAGVKNTGGYDAAILSIVRSGHKLGITTQLVSPGADCAVNESLTKPHVLVKFNKPRRIGRVHFTRQDETRDCGQPSGPFCGGIAAFPCPGSGECVDNPDDGCDPNNGGADCGGVCQCNIRALCIQGLIFDPSPEVCACVPDASQDPCAAVRCEAGTHCEADGDQAACVPDAKTCGGIANLPCPGNAKCVDNPDDNCDPNNGGADCGGICVCIENQLCVQGFVWDGTACKCVPAGGGDDNPCLTTLCPQGTRCDLQNGGPVCVSDGTLACGKNTCAEGQVCCNASCGICTQPDEACIQIACEP